MAMQGMNFRSLRVRCGPAPFAGPNNPSHRIWTRPAHTADHHQQILFSRVEEVNWQLLR